MSSTTGMAAAAIYSFAMSSPAALGAVPEDSAAKNHHLMNGKGFTNPWESCREFHPLSIMGVMIG
jgi:N-acyl-phosphatidylethanolamine-hydrolysing phospholipase D